MPRQEPCSWVAVETVRQSLCLRGREIPNPKIQIPNKFQLTNFKLQMGPALGGENAVGPSGVAARSKAALKRPHSKRFAKFEALGAARQRLECGRFSAAFPQFTTERRFPNRQVHAQRAVAPNPKGIPSLSPGLRAGRYPGSTSQTFHNPEGVASLTRRSIRAGRFNPFRVEDHFSPTPRVARSSQPWADGCNPFRIANPLPTALRPLKFGAWILEFIWDLGFGIWDFPTQP